MSTLYLTRGMMGSGKTTWAKSWVREDPENRIRVNRDDLRVMSFSKKVGLSFEQENYITELSQTLVRRGLERGSDVVADDMNLRPKYIREWYKVAKDAGAEDVQIKEFLLPLETLLWRNGARAHADMVDERVIKNIYSKYLQKDSLLPVESYEEFLSKEDSSFSMVPADPFDPNSPLPLAVVFDIDGTLANNLSGRGWFDWSRVAEDTPHPAVAHLAYIMDDVAHVLCLSGRDAICRSETEQWLEEHGIPFADLHMRSEGDGRPDAIVKYELFNEHIRDKYNVWFVVDDRPAVCRMWRELGLTVLQVGDPHIEF